MDPDPRALNSIKLNIGCFSNSVIYDLALIQSFFGLFEINCKNIFPQCTSEDFKNDKILLIGQILV